MAEVILVRHAMPEIEQGVASKLWGLSESAREDCVLLAHALPPGITAIRSSEERKARETADVLGLRLGLPVQVDARLGEVDRPPVWDREYREVAAGYLAGADETGWEAPASVLGRFDAAMTAAREVVDGTVLVVSHGMALSLWVAGFAGADFDVVSWWRELTLPDAWAVDVKERRLERVWMGGRTAD